MSLYLNISNVPYLHIFPIFLLTHPFSHRPAKLSTTGRTDNSTHRSEPFWIEELFKFVC